MRQLTSHKVNGLNDAIRIVVMDKPGDGSANHWYAIQVEDGDDAQTTDIRFQKGPIKEAGINGTSNEALLAIVEDRLLGFQSGRFACRENALALTNLQQCMLWLKKRTEDRLQRGVEGTHEQ